MAPSTLSPSQSQNLLALLCVLWEIFCASTSLEWLHSFVIHLPAMHYLDCFPVLCCWIAKLPWRSSYTFPGVIHK